jgi:TfoX/Sxy family transcriptional regulator of competence genes
MFGGVGWLFHGNMCVGVWKRWLIARLGADSAEALREQHVKPFDITGKALSGWVMIDQEGLATEDALKKWVDQCVALVKTLPKKE